MKQSLSKEVSDGGQDAVPAILSLIPKAAGHGSCMASCLAGVQVITSFASKPFRPSPQVFVLFESRMVYNCVYSIASPGSVLMIV